MLCPTCREPLDPGFECGGGHRFALVDGVLRLLDPPSARRLEAFLEPFQRLREQERRRIHDPTVFPRLPDALRHDPEWRMRGYDLALLRRLLAGRAPGAALDVGAWNGWLSHHLAAASHRVTAVDYFVDELDGLGAWRFYPTRWRSIQMDVRDLSVLDERFDLVVLNRCLQFSLDPPAMALDAAERVAPGGLLVVTGLELFADPSERRLSVEGMLERLRRAGVEPFVPVKGYLDRDDRRRLLAAGVELRPYPQLRMRLALLRARLRPTRGQPCYGMLRR
jgi:SAM-dependent methyltransferase